MASLLRGTSIVGSLTLLSRVLGFVRDLLQARLLGTGLQADAFVVAFRIPNLLRSIFAEGALTSAFVPVVAEDLTHSHNTAVDTIRSVTSLLLASTLVLTGLGILFAPELIQLMAPGFASNSTKLELSIELTRVMMPYIIFVSIVAMLNGALNSVKIFGASAWAQVWMNATLIIGALIAPYFPSNLAVYILSISVIIGGLVQIVAQLPALKRANFSILPSANFITPQTIKIMKLMVPAIFGAAIYQLLIFMNTVFASLLPEGSVSWLYYADRLTQLPIGVFSIALASVLLPSLSFATATNDTKAYSKGLADALRFSSFFLMPLIAFILVAAPSIIELLFQRRAFDAFSTQQTASAVRAYSLGIWGISCQSLLIRGFAARKDTITPTIIGLITLFCTAIFSLTLMGPISANLTGPLAETLMFVQKPLLSLGLNFEMHHTGLALSSSLASAVSLIVAHTLLKRKVESLELSQFYLASAKSTIASIGMFAAMYLAPLYIPALAGSALLNVIATAFVGTITYGILSLILKSSEFYETVAIFSRLIKES